MIHVLSYCIHIIPPLCFQPILWIALQHEEATDLGTPGVLCFHPFIEFLIFLVYSDYSFAY